MTTAAQRASAHGAALRDSKRPPDRLVVLNCYYAHKLPMGADECARRIGWKKSEKARKRVTELHQAGELIETGRLVPTEDGGKQAEYRIAQPGAQLSLLESLT